MASAVKPYLCDDYPPVLPGAGHTMIDVQKMKKAPNASVIYGLYVADGSVYLRPHLPCLLSESAAADSVEAAEQASSITG